MDIGQGAFKQPFGGRNGAPKDLLSITVLQNVVSGIPLVLNLGTRMSDPYVNIILKGSTL